MKSQLLREDINKETTHCLAASKEKDKEQLVFCERKEMQRTQIIFKLYGNISGFILDMQRRSCSSKDSFIAECDREPKGHCA